MTEDYTKENHWYGHNGGPCPVHPETEVDVMTAGGLYVRPCTASGLTWGLTEIDASIIAFRITRLYREPVIRDFRLTFNEDGTTEVKTTWLVRPGETIHVREVLEDEA